MMFLYSKFIIAGVLCITTSAIAMSKQGKVIPQSNLCYFQANKTPLPIVTHDTIHYEIALRRYFSDTNERIEEAIIIAQKVIKGPCANNIDAALACYAGNKLVYYGTFSEELARHYWHLFETHAKAWIQNFFLRESRERPL